jgi:hypothetical protein
MKELIKMTRNAKGEVVGTYSDGTKVKFKVPEDQGAAAILVGTSDLEVIPPKRRKK